MRNRRPRVVLVGQTPPPFGGQAIMIERLVSGTYRQVEIYHVPLAFSQEMDQVGKVTLGKLFHILSVIARIAGARLRFRADVLYYPPAGPNLVPVCRDIAILLLTRWMFRRVVFHFHAGGLSELYSRLPRALRVLYRRAYYGADLAIRLSRFSPEDGRLLRARAERVIPYGIEDRAAGLLGRRPTRPRITTILYVGVLKETKGLLILLDALAVLCNRGVDCEFLGVGKFESATFRDTVLERARSLRVESHIRFPGVLVGDEKDGAFLGAGIFCFPSFFEAESLSVAVIEAMQFSLPVVGTQWRGIQSLVEEGVTGFLVPPHDSAALAARLETLLTDPDRARAMGESGRARYLRDHTLQRYREQVERAICDVTDQTDA